MFMGRAAQQHRPREIRRRKSRRERRRYLTARSQRSWRLLHLGRPACCGSLGNLAIVERLIV
jgi:hypothetical protein